MPTQMMDLRSLQRTTCRCDSFFFCHVMTQWLLISCRYL
jgi:hypothetical protein